MDRDLEITPAGGSTGLDPKPAPNAVEPGGAEVEAFSTSVLSVTGPALGSVLPSPDGGWAQSVYQYGQAAGDEVSLANFRKDVFLESGSEG